MSVSVSHQQKVYKLSELIAHYELGNRAEDKSPKTISWYSENLERFLSYLQSHHLSDSLDNINIRVLCEYDLYLIKTDKFRNRPHTSTSSSHYQRQQSTAM